MTAGRIFHDGFGEITRVRQELAWYPDDVRRYRMAAGWMRIGQLEPFIGRCGEVGDDLGSQIVAMTLAQDVVRMAFWLERPDGPYTKCLGTTFTMLPIGSLLTPHLDASRYARARSGDSRGRACACQAAQCSWLDRADQSGSVPFWNRSFQMVAAEQFSEALIDTITDRAVRPLPQTWAGSTSSWIRPTP